VELIRRKEDHKRWKTERSANALSKKTVVPRGEAGKKKQLFGAVSEVHAKKPCTGNPAITGAERPAPPRTKGKDHEAEQERSSLS